ncbi:hypothetical protein PTMSG1_07925 [Pyrenophora teres f. maculata]|nr:hypothetical protein PTMSG1_07925 [Pyrenophora teres f. maculata]
MAAGIMEANEILLTIDPYWHMFNFVLEHQPRRETNLTIQRTPQLPWIVTKSYSQPGTRAFYHFPHINMWTLPDPYWRLASYKFMHCDYSIILFLMYLERALARYGATVKWLTVKTRPYVLFHRQYERPDADVRHSVFEITARSGNQYIADFTIEQFGYPGYMWFMNKTVYMFQSTYAATRQASDGGTQMNLFDRQLQTGDGDALFRNESLSSSETAYSPRPVG